MILIRGNFGGLANRIRTFAHVVALAHETSNQVVNTSFSRWRSYFPSINDDPWCCYPEGSNPKGDGIQLAGITDQEVFIKEIKGEVCLIDIGWHRSFRLDSARSRELLTTHSLVVMTGFGFRHSQINHHRDEILRFFAPDPSIAAAARKVLDPMRKQCHTIVGVHLRRGDYANWQGGRYLYDDEQYVAAIRRTAELIGSGVGFVVCSDEEIGIGDVPGIEVSMGTGNEMEDLVILAGCDYIVGPPSTYSEWASFYGLTPKYTMIDPDHGFTMGDFHIPHDLGFTPLLP